MGRVAATGILAMQFQAQYAEACNPLAFAHPLQIHSAMSPFFIPHTSSSLDVVFESVWATGSAGKNVGFKLTQSGKEVAQGVCEQESDGQVPGAIGFLPNVRCAIPPLAVGIYDFSVSGDRSCGKQSYWATDVHVEIIEPAHINSITPAHGPAKADSNITVAGTNIGGPHVTCEYTYEAGEGAKLDGSGNPLGCSMSTAAYPALSFTATSVSCQTPEWPGPMLQCGAADGCHPVEGAVCSRKMRVSISNEAKVHSPETVHFTYDDTVEVIV